MAKNNCTGSLCQVILSANSLSTNKYKINVLYVSTELFCRQRDIHDFGLAHKSKKPTNEFASGFVTGINNVQLMRVTDSSYLVLS